MDFFPALSSRQTPIISPIPSNLPHFAPSPDCSYPSSSDKPKTGNATDSVLPSRFPVASLENSPALILSSSFSFLAIQPLPGSGSILCDEARSFLVQTDVPSISMI